MAQPTLLHEAQLQIEEKDRIIQSLLETNKRTTAVFETLLRHGSTISSEIELERLVQLVTDIGTELSGAQFGAFFYNVLNRQGESYLLYTISGVAKEAFSKFPKPRNTKIFEPTFSGRGTVRYDDVTANPDYGKNPPYHGMPKGHLPVKSYLATPVISPVTKEVIGGLFFGHSDAAVFTPESEQLIEGIAAQAAIAMGNARLFEEKKYAEQRLLDQREQYRSIFQATFDALLIYDLDGRIVEVNPAACNIHGYSYEEMTKLNARDIINGEPERFSDIVELVRTGREFSGIEIHRRKDGRLIEVEIAARPFNFGGQIHVLETVRDITRSRETEAALRRSEAFAEVITNASPVTLWMTNDQAETIYINKTFEDWTGIPLEQQLGTGWLQSIVTEDRERAAQIFMNAFNGRRLFSTDFRVHFRNGEVRWCAVTGSPYYDRDGNFAGFAGSLTDITERKMAEQKLSSQNALINTITANTLQALFMMDDNQRCTYMNPAAEKMTGFKLHEVQEKPLHYYIHHTHPDGRHFPIEECAIDRALPTRMQTQGEEVFIHKEGFFYPVAFTASPIIENGRPVGTVIEARDITEEKRIEAELRRKDEETRYILEEKVKERTSELEKKNYELLQFTSVASHDLKEPLRKISIFGGLLREKLEHHPDPSIQRGLENIVQSSRRMSNLITDLLAFSRISKEHPEFVPVDLNELLESIENDLEISIHEKNTTIAYSDLPTVMGIPLQLGQVFQNLISNSLKFAHPDRNPEIFIYRETITVNGLPYHKIIYTDNGIGFRNEYAETIFEIFNRLHTRDEYEGTGIGLAIVKKIISVHKGSVRAFGSEGQGSRFEILLPATTPE